MRAPSPSRSVRIDVAGVVVRVLGASTAARAWIRERYGPFLSRRPATITMTLTSRRDLSWTRVPRLAWRDGRLGLTIGPCRVDGDVETGRLRLTAPPSPAMLSPGLLRALCCLFLVRAGGILLHASGVVHRGRAWVFCGQSESGKTTIARLAGARTVLNDETVAVRPAGARWIAHATPFFGEGGTEMARVAAAAPVRALCFLRKADHFAHRRLTPREAVERAFPQVFLPKRDPGVADRILGVLAALAAQVPCYELSFAPRSEIWGYLDGIE